MTSSRYFTSDLPEDQYEPGSDGTVLRNLLGISDRHVMEVNETAQLWLTQQKLIAEITQDHRFIAADLCRIHEQWLGGIYPWAGRYREVNLSKAGFTFAMARTIPALMQEFEENQLARYTPCLFEKMEEVTLALAEVHVELMLIHPFREGNGRLGRILATLMALQAGLPLLDFSELADGLREDYFAAVRAGLDRNYEPMRGLFLAVIERTFSHLE
jgi:cell filamentation protein